MKSKAYKKVIKETPIDIQNKVKEIEMINRKHRKAKQTHDMLTILKWLYVAFIVIFIMLILWFKIIKG